MSDNQTDDGAHRSPQLLTSEAVPQPKESPGVSKTTAMNILRTAFMGVVLMKPGR